MRIVLASASGSSDTRSRYAESRKSKRRRATKIRMSSFHCDAVRSQPVGPCAAVWTRTRECGGTDKTAYLKADQFRDLVEGS
jgi:hypothetical protein